MKLLLLIICALAPFRTSAQEPRIDYSAAVPVTNSLASKLVLCPNGNTMLFSFTPGSGIRVCVYDAGHDLVAQATPDTGLLAHRRMSDLDVRAIFGCGNVVAMFVKTPGTDGAPALFRASFSQESGRYLGAELVAPEPRPQRRGKRNRRAMDAVQYTIRRDPASGAYAVASYVDYPARSERLPIIYHYNSRHEEIGNYVIGVNEAGINTYFKDMTVQGEGAVWVATIEHPFRADSAGMRAATVLTRLSRGGMEPVRLGVSESLEPPTVVLGYDPVGRLLQLVVKSWPGAVVTGVSGSNPAPVLFSLDAGNTGVLRQAPLDFSAVSASRDRQYPLRERYTSPISEKRYQPKDLPYDGVPTDIFVDSNSGPEIVCRGTGDLVSHDLALVRCDGRGASGSGFCIRRRNVLPLGQSVGKIRRGELSFRSRSSADAPATYVAFDYLKSGGQSFFLVNEAPEAGRGNPGAARPLDVVSGAETICYRISGTEMSRFSLFGPGGGGIRNRFADFLSAASDENAGKYAVLVTENTGRGKRERIAWISF